MTLIYFILVLGITILIHEFGHFIFAKKAGVYCYEFSIGMGPRLFKWKRKNDETEYSLRLFPIGGYVAMAGESTEMDPDVPKKKHLQYKTWWQRFSIMFAGVFFNYLLAIVCFTIVALKVGAPTNVPYVQSVSEGYSAYEKHVPAESEIIKINDTKIMNMDHLTLVITSLKGKDITLTVKTKEGNIESYELTPKKEQENGEDVYRYGFAIGTEVEHGILASIKYGFTKMFSLFYQMILIIGYLISGKLSLSALSGPVGIYNIVGESARAGLINLVYLVGYLCVNVGVINIIPLPAFDGGHILFLIIEKIKGKPVSQKVENTIHSIGMILLIILMIAISINDIIKLIK